MVKIFEGTFYSCYVNLIIVIIVHSRVNLCISLKLVRLPHQKIFRDRAKIINHLDFLSLDNYFRLCLFNLFLRHIIFSVLIYQIFLELYVISIITVSRLLFFRPNRFSIDRSSCNGLNDKIVKRRLIQQCQLTV